MWNQVACLHANQHCALQIHLCKYPFEHDHLLVYVWYIYRICAVAVTGLSKIWLKFCCYEVLWVKFYYSWRIPFDCMSNTMLLNDAKCSFWDLYQLGRSSIKYILINLHLASFHVLWNIFSFFTIRFSMKKKMLLFCCIC
jgi:hypothetical protein